MADTAHPDDEDARGDARPYPAGAASPDRDGVGGGGGGGDDGGEGGGGDGVLAGLSHLVEKVDDLAGAEDNPANRLGGDESRHLPWIGVLLAGAAVLLVPWIVYLAFTLPSRALSPNYDIAWAGFDCLLLVSLGATAVAVLRRSRWTAAAAGATAGLLVTDAWFDVVTSPAGAAQVEAIVLAALVELPLAGLCAWTAGHATDIVERRIEIFVRRRPRRPNARD